MRLVHFKINEVDRVYINPEQVVAIKPLGGGTRIFVSAGGVDGGPSFDVPIPVDDVAVAIAGARID